MSNRHAFIFFALTFEKCGKRLANGERYVHPRAVACPQSSLLVLGVSVGYQLDQVVVGVTHVQTGPGALGA